MFTRIHIENIETRLVIAISGLGGLQSPAPGLRGQVCFGAPLKKGRYPPVSSNIAMGNHLEVAAMGKSLNIYLGKL